MQPFQICKPLPGNSILKIWGEGIFYAFFGVHPSPVLQLHQQPKLRKAALEINNRGIEVFEDTCRKAGNRTT